MSKISEERKSTKAIVDNAFPLAKFYATKSQYEDTLWRGIHTEAKKTSTSKKKPDDDIEVVFDKNPKKSKNDAIAQNGKQGKNKENNNNKLIPNKVPHGVAALNLQNEIVNACKEFPGILHENIGPTWYKALRNEFKKPYMKNLDGFVGRERKKTFVYPPPDQLWAWTQYFDITETKVVIIGKNPWTNEHDKDGGKNAHGLSFSTKREVDATPTLLNIFKELERDPDVNFTRPNHGCLEGWAQQGVLLLNAVLTIGDNRSGRSASHRDRGWEDFTDQVCRIICEKVEKGVVFCMWGYQAQKKRYYIGDNHEKLMSQHPSPICPNKGAGFVKNCHFSKINSLLKKHGRDPIDWSYLP